MSWIHQRILAIAICVVILLAIGIFMLWSVVQNQQRQIDMLCSATWLTLCNNKTNCPEEYSYQNLEADVYFVRFADYNRKSAILERLIHSEKHESRYTWVYDIPPDTLKGLKSDQLVDIPTNKPK